MTPAAPIREAPQPQVKGDGTVILSSAQPTTAAGGAPQTARDAYSAALRSYEALQPTATER